MIVVDIEASGVDLERCGIWQVGAIELENPNNTFFQECRIEKEYIFLFDGDWQNKKPEEVLGKTEEELRDNRQSEKELLTKFFEWVEKINVKTLVCHNPQFDHAFLEHKARKYGLKFNVGYKAIDLHSIAFLKYFQEKGEMLIKEGKSDMGLKSILKLLGIEDKRGFHNALEDAKLTAECFSRLVYGKKLFKESE